LLETRDESFARWVEGTEEPEDVEEHEAYCDYVHDTLTWLDVGCCATAEVAEDEACDDLRGDWEAVYEGSCR